MTEPPASGRPPLVIWVDAQLPPALARWLAVDFSVDAHHVADLDLLDADDLVIFRAAGTTRTSVIVTKDEDYLRLLDQHGAPPQIVWITCGNIRNADLHALISAAWPRVSELLDANEPLVEVGRRK
ncbi:MAG: DUF5615 family PIN-like protein [bacterium]